MAAAERMKKRKSNNPDSVLLQPKIMKLPVYSITFLLLGLPVVRAAESTPALAPELPAAAERGDDEAQFQLARAYLRGEGVAKDPQKAFELMKASADQGNAEAIGGLGYFYSVGVAVPKDEKQALEWFRKGAEKGSAKAQLNLGKALIDGKPGAFCEMTADQMREAGLQWIWKSADQGLPEAGLTYGRICYFGDYGQPQDYKKALVYLNPAAADGIPEAQNMLGSIYQCGSGIPIDEVAAEQWYRKAALQGHSRAQSNLGMILGPQVENKQTRVEALAWLLMAAEQNQITAIKTLKDAEPLKTGELDEARTKMAELAKLVKQRAP
jgi:TPR repeat protein